MRGVMVIGPAGPEVEAARELLARNGIAHSWVDPDRDPVAPFLESG